MIQNNPNLLARAMNNSISESAIVVEAKKRGGDHRLILRPQESKSTRPCLGGRSAIWLTTDECSIRLAWTTFAITAHDGISY